MEEEKAALEAEIQQKEEELNQLTENIEKAEGDDKQELEDKKALLVADVAVKKARLDELNEEPAAGVPPAPSEAAAEAEPEPPAAEAEPAPTADEEPVPPADGKLDDVVEPVPISDSQPKVDASQPKVDAPKPKPAPSGETSDSGNLTREQMLTVLQDEKARLIQSLQDGSSKPLGEDMEKWLATLKNLRKEGIIAESDVKVDKIETKLKLQPAGGDPKKIEEEIAEIDKIISIQDENEFRKEFSQWHEKHQAAAINASAGSPPGKPGARGNVPFPDANVLAQLKEAEARAAKAAIEVEALKKKLAEYAQKENMTADDIKDMEETQKLLMEKMAEFEKITKLIQSLIGLADTPSSQLGIRPSTDGDKASNPEENLPKVIVCGTGDIDTVPKIIICETTGEKGGKKPVFQELDGPVRDRLGGGPGGPAGYPGGQTSYPGGPGGYPGGPGGYPGVPGGYPGGPVGYPVRPEVYPGGPGGYPGGLGGYPGDPSTFPVRAGPVMYLGGMSACPGGQGAFPGSGGCPGEAQAGGYPGGPGYQVGPAAYPVGPSPYPDYPVPYPTSYPGMARPGMTPVPPCVNYYSKSKEDKKKKKKHTEKQPAMDYSGSSGCNNWCKSYEEKKREKRKKKCFCQLAGFCPKN